MSPDMGTVFLQDFSMSLLKTQQLQNIALNDPPP